MHSIQIRQLRPPLLPTVLHPHCDAFTQQTTQPCSQLLPFGGYSLPSRSTLGVQVQRSLSGTESSTAGMWAPHPHQVALSVIISMLKGDVEVKTYGRWNK